MSLVNCRSTVKFAWFAYAYSKSLLTCNVNSSKCLIVKALATGLILRRRRRTGRAVHTRNRAGKITDAYCAIEDLRCIEQRGWSRAALRRQDALLLLRGIGNVRVESDRQ